jgi:pSer/pThr/pTyr-binding forkhead associated (FHA) protein
MAFVTIRIKGAEGYTRTALSKDRMVLGRASDTDIPIKHASISREHAAFTREGDDWFVEDLGSSNGSYVGKDKLTGKVKLAEKDIIKCGKARLTFHLGEMGAADAAVDISGDDELDLDDGDGPAATVADGVPDAMVCKDCGLWMSTAHRATGEHMNCPRCGHANAVAAH